MNKKITLSIAACIAIFTTTQLSAQIVTSGLDDGSDGTLRFEIAETPMGGIITFDPAVTTVNLNSEIVIDKDLTIDGGDALTTVDADRNGRIFNITAGTVIINSLRIQRGRAFNGGGIYMTNSSVTLNGCIVKNNQGSIVDIPSGSGGGIYIDAGGVLVVNSSTIEDNTAYRAGGGIEDNSGAGLGLTLNSVRLRDNNAGVDAVTSAPGNGGGLHITGAGDVVIINGSVTGNVAFREGGGLWNGTGVMTLNGVLVDSNTAFGALAANGGAGIFNNGGTLNVLNESVVSNNIAGGAAASGGGLLSTAGAVTVNNSTFDSNSANRAGGAIELIEGTLNFVNSTMSNNDVNGTAGTPNPGNGGGFHATGLIGAVNFNGSSIYGNDAANEGGALWHQNGAVLNVRNSALYGNSAAEGGAIYNNTGAFMIIRRSTVSGNSATVEGGGISNNGASLSLNAVTVALNTAVTGGGIIGVNNVTLKNTIVALNTAGSGADLAGIISSNNYNLIGSDDLNVFTPQANDLEGVDPVVGPLQDNGGTTLTHQLLDGSPAYNAGDPADVFADQINQPVFGTSRDIGAYESQVVLSIDEFNAESVMKIYPNPNNGKFKIVIADNVVGAVDVQIVSVTGQLVQKFTIGSGINPVDINNMSAGMYLVKINTEEGSSVHKLILK